MRRCAGGLDVRVYRLLQRVALECGVRMQKILRISSINYIRRAKS